eukprot:IDg21186t1
MRAVHACSHACMHEITADADSAPARPIEQRRARLCALAVHAAVSARVSHGAVNAAMQTRSGDRCGGPFQARFYESGGAVRCNAHRERRHARHRR